MTVRNRRRSDLHEDLNVWTAFTDLMSNSFMILTLFIFIFYLSVNLKLSKLESQESDTPPIILIPDTGTFRFTSGSAELSSSLDKFISRELFNQIVLNTQKYQIDVVEIIGHTDGQANSGSISNLDVNLENVARGGRSVKSLVAGSNADLGLMRALAVANTLRSLQKSSGKLKGLQFRAYSAGQLVLPDGSVASPSSAADGSRRRIEIRFTRLGKVTKAQ